MRRGVNVGFERRRSSSTNGRAVGSIIELGAWVIDHAIAEAATWPGRTDLRPRVAINLTARQLHDDHLVERVADACTASRLSPGALCLELTESAFVATDDYGAYRVLETLRDMGVEVAIDDFGTGYSALSYLKHLPVDVIKIDQGFVAGLGTDAADALLVEAIIRVAHGSVCASWPRGWRPRPSSSCCAASAVTPSRATSSPARRRARRCPVCSTPPGGQLRARRGRQCPVGRRWCRHARRSRLPVSWTHPPTSRSDLGPGPEPGLPMTTGGSPSGPIHVRTRTSTRHPRSPPGTSDRQDAQCRHAHAPRREVTRDGRGGN